MQLSTKARYAVMALVDMVHIQRELNTDLPVKLDKVSRRQSISLSYLEQLFMALRRGGVVKSVRGPGGGYVLAKEAKDIYLIDVIEAVQEPLKFSRCNGMGLTKGKGCMTNGGSCNTHELWMSLSAHIGSFLQCVSLEMVLEDRSCECLTEEGAKLIA